MRLAAIALLASAALISGPQPNRFTKQDKAFFGDPRVIAFVRPGLTLKITGAGVAADGTITVRYTVTDPQGLPLDLSGITTPGAITPSYMASFIPAGASDYIAKPVNVDVLLATVWRSLQQRQSQA